MTREEFNLCVDDHADNLYRFMVKGVHDGERARDLVQDAFATLWVNREAVESAKSKSYLFTVAYNNMIDSIRKEGRMSVCDAAAGAGVPAQGHFDLNEILHMAVDRLPAEQRSVVLLRDYEGYSYGEIGAITGLSPAQVKVYIYRARVFLREYIGSIDKLI